MRPCTPTTLRRHLVLSITLLCCRGAIAQTIAFDPEVRLRVGHVPEPLVSADMNRDGVPDIVVANSAADGGPGGNFITLLSGNGDGTFQAGTNFDVGGDRPESVLVALIDDDDDPDVVTANYGSSSISTLLGNGRGGFGRPIITRVPGGPRFVVAAELDGDGVIDLATANYDNHTVSILKGYSNGRFTISTSIPVGESPEVVAVGRLTNDGIPDLVACNRFDHTITALQGQGDGNFTPGAPHEVERFPRFIVLVDLDGDAIDDVIVANNAADSLTLERSDGALGFSRAGRLTVASTSLTLREPVYLTLGDMNRDGANDLLTTWAKSNAFTVFPRAEGAFAFGSPSMVTTGATPVGIAASDLDADGDQDVVVANANDDSLSIFVSYDDDPGLILDNGQPGTTALGAWVTSDAPFPLGGSSLFSKDGTRYSWELAVPEAGRYEALMWWTVTSSRATAIPVEVQHRDGQSSLLVDQTSLPGVWHSLGVYDFSDRCTVAITSPQSTRSVSADAVRLRKLPSAPAVFRGSIGVVPQTRPLAYKIDKNTILAFHGKLAVDNDQENESFVAALFAPIGPGQESSEIAQLKLFIDANNNGEFDVADRQLGEPRSFASDVRTVVFEGFRETLRDGQTADLFVVAELAPAAVAARAAIDGSSGSSQPALAMVFALAAVGFLARRRRGLLQVTAGCSLLAVAFLIPVAGCKGGGGGGRGSAQNLQVELTAIVSEGADSRAPSVNAGLPAQGWRF